MPPFCNGLAGMCACISATFPQLITGRHKIAVVESTFTFQGEQLFGALHAINLFYAWKQRIWFSFSTFLPLSGEFCLVILDKVYLIFWSGSELVVHFRMAT